MKNIFKLFALIGLFFCFSSCEKESVGEPSLEVTPANLDGIWKLSEWNGQVMDENTYCYVIFHTVTDSAAV